MDFLRIFSGLAITFIILIGIWNFSNPIAQDYSYTVPAFNELNNTTAITDTVSTLSSKVENADVSLIGTVDFVVTGLYSFGKAILSVPRIFDKFVDSSINLLGPYFPSWLTPYIKALFYLTILTIVVAVLARLYPGVISK
jgi:hypothetical protein